jgi:hypothetical protein
MATPDQSSCLEKNMKQLSTGLRALALSSLIASLALVQAQTSAVPRRMEGSFHYDITREVTLHGTVSSVVTKHSPGMIMGSHLFLTTVSGPVDASLGRFALRGKGALTVASGQQVELTGIMKTINGRQVFLTRTVKAGGRVFQVRNERGMLISPQARARASRKNAGEAL